MELFCKKCSLPVDAGFVLEEICLQLYEIYFVNGRGKEILSLL